MTRLMRSLSILAFLISVAAFARAETYDLLIRGGRVVDGMGGAFMRQPTDEELIRMKELVERGMKDGALGLSTGLIYLPGTFTKTEEIIELAKVASAYDGMYVSHMRDEGLDIQDSLNEL